MVTEEREKAGRGRSEKKRAAQAVEELAEQLAGLSEAEAKGVPASAELLAELRLARATQGHGSRQRQIKHLAGELRRRPEDLEAVRDFLAGRHQRQLDQNRAFHHLEELRDRLCDPGTFEAAMAELAPQVAAKEQEEIARLARSCHRPGDRRAYREIFRRLRRVLAGELEP